ncbi:MAG: PQQ-like beta-propeller repeat protein [Verrucomicrobiae bacterium]|nr:PQQ-like beta-propeller repeat protein [Verrucomicrobiae bacterium]
MKAFHRTVLGLALSTAGLAGDWPQWHGPNRDNICRETGLLASWPPGGPPLVWKASGIGEGYSTVSVAGGRIYTMGDVGDSALLIALDFNTGKKLWQARVGPSGECGRYYGPRATPTVDGDLVFSLGQFGDLSCHHALTGKELWRKNLKTDFNGRMMSHWGYSESPLVDGERLLCTPGGADGTVVALNKRTGALVWRTKELTDSAAYTSLLPVVINGVRQAIVYTDEHVAGVALDSGKILWSAERKGKTAVIPMPIYKDNHVFVTSGYGIGCNLFKITGNKATEVYASAALENHHGGVILIGDHVYGHSNKGGWTCLEFKTGKVVWTERQKLGKGTLTYADGHFYCRDERVGMLVLIEATPAGWKEKGRFQQPDRSAKNSWPHLVISHGRLFVRDQDLLLCYDVRKK